MDVTHRPCAALLRRVRRCALLLLGVEGCATAHRAQYVLYLNLMVYAG